jgi:hypothetical protein
VTQLPTKFLKPVDVQPHEQRKINLVCTYFFLNISISVVVYNYESTLKVHSSAVHYCVGNQVAGCLFYSTFVRSLFVDPQRLLLSGRLFVARKFKPQKVLSRTKRSTCTRESYLSLASREKLLSRAQGLSGAIMMSVHF